MRKLIVLSMVVFAMSLGTSALMAQGQGDDHAVVVVPDSSVEHPGDAGVRSHTNHVILIRPERHGGGGGGGDVINSVETPGSLACIYGTAPTLTAGCPNAGSSSPGNVGSPSLTTGGSGTIAIVDAYDYPTAENDLNVFSAQFKLPGCTVASGCFSVVYASGKPAGNCGWNQEAALDIEWAHAMAPGANIVLVEANSNSNADLFDAVQVATNLVKSGPGGVGEVSMSWGGTESSTESTYDGFMSTSGVTYFAASGDSGGKVIYPSASPNVVSCGGTSIVRDSSTGSFVTEQGWSGSGGGASRYEARPSYQDPIVSLVGSLRGTPDLASDADPYSGVWVYDTTTCNGASGWLVFGGTSVATPSLAGIVNLASSKTTGFATGSFGEQTRVYGCFPNSCYNPGYFFDVTAGSAGRLSAKTGWDFVTGIGSNQGLNGK